MSKITLQLPDSLAKRLHDEAQHQAVSPEQIVGAALALYFEEPSKADILDSIRQSLEDMKAGRMRPMDDILTELRSNFYANE